LDNSTCLLDDLADKLPLIDRESQRFLAVNIFACPASIDKHLRMPMIWSPNRHHIDILAREQIPVILACKRGAAKGGFGLVSHIPIHIADCHDIAKILRLVGDHRTLVA
jgi:hypothetical protein